MSVGVTELHGQLPVDCESILAEAAAIMMAEKAGRSGGDQFAVLSCRSYGDWAKHSEYFD